MADANQSASHFAARTGTEPAPNIVTEFADAARSAAESLLDEQKRQIAERVSGLAEALRSAGQSLGQSQNGVVARYAEQAADQIDNLARNIRNRGWGELVADTEELARRQPTWFVLGAVATGFLVGRLMWTSSHRSRSFGEPSRGETTRAVTAAVSSGSGAETPTGPVETAGYGVGSSGGMGTR